MACYKCGYEQAAHVGGRGTGGRGFRATVSRVINNTRNVDAQLHEVVWRAITADRYVPNRAARSLVDPPDRHHRPASSPTSEGHDDDLLRAGCWATRFFGRVVGRTAGVSCAPGFAALRCSWSAVTRLGYDWSAIRGTGRRPTAALGAVVAAARRVSARTAGGVRERGPFFFAVLAGKNRPARPNADQLR